MTRARAGSPWLTGALWLLAALLALRLGILAGQSIEQPAHGFVANYAAGRIIIEGQDASRLADDEWFVAQVQRFEPTVVDIYGANLPTTAMFMAPLALLDYRTSRALWTGISFLALLLVLAWLVHTCRLGSVWAPVFVSLALWSQPVRENLSHAQTYIVLLCIAAVAWSGFRRGVAVNAGAPVGILLVLKSAGSMYWPMLAVCRRWRALAWAGGVAVAAALASVAAVGIETWRVWLSTTRTLTDSASLSVTAYQTQWSLLRHLTTPDARWNPEPLLVRPELGNALVLLAAFALLAVTARIVWRSQQHDLTFAAFTLLTLILSPVSLDYHYALALLPIAILLARVGGRPTSLPVLLVCAGALLIAADLPYRSPRLAAGALSLLAYPKLYGAYLLLGVALYYARRPADEAPAG